MVELLNGGSSCLPDLETIAQNLGIGKKNLQLKLKTEGTSFRELRNQVQCERAKSLLKSQRFSIAEAAYLLGYSDPGTFSRNFRCWTGMPAKVFVAAL